MREKRKEKKPMRIKVHFTVPLVWCVVFLSGMGAEGVFSLLATLIHEGGHLFMMAALGEKPLGVTVLPFGILMKREGGRSYRADLLVALGGPMANALALLFLLPHLWRSPSSAIVFFASANGCAMLLNLLPHPSLDGGDALRAALMSVLSPGRGEAVMRFCSDMTLIPFVCFVLWLLFYQEGNVTLYLLCTFLLLSLAKIGEE